MKVLVAYSSRRGATAGIAEAIAGTLRREGIAVRCVDSRAIAELDPFDAVVLGSALYAKPWPGEAHQFLRRHRRALAQMPFWIFSSGPVGDPNEDQPEWVEPSRLVEAAEKLGMRDHAVFGGCLPTDPHGPIERALVASTPPEHRDRRDWDEIREWAMLVAAQLRTAIPARGPADRVRAV